MTEVRDLKITSTSTERQRRSQNLAPVLVIISGSSLVFSRKIIASTGFYRCCAPGASAPVVVQKSVSHEGGWNRLNVTAFGWSWLNFMGILVLVTKNELLRFRAEGGAKQHFETTPRPTTEQAGKPTTCKNTSQHTKCEIPWNTSSDNPQNTPKVRKSYLGGIFLVFLGILGVFFWYFRVYFRAPP